MCHIAILFGIPIHKEEYLARISNSDYLKKYRSKPEESWHLEYNELIAKPFQELAYLAQNSMNIDVRLRATLKDLNEVSKMADVIIIISHWKNYKFPNDDLITPISSNKFHQISTQVNEPLAQCLTQAFERHQNYKNYSKQSMIFNLIRFIRFTWDSDQTIREILENSLDININHELPMIEGVSGYVESDLKRRTRRRDLIDNLFPELLVPGNRLELFDGLHNCTTVSEAIDREFKGLLDLTTCTSTILADYISMYHQYQFRVVQFNKRQEPIWAATVLNATLSLILADKYGYLDARQQSIQLAREAVQLTASVDNIESFSVGKFIMSLKKVLQKQASQWRMLGGSPAEAIIALSTYKRNIIRRLFLNSIIFLILLGFGTYISISLFSNQSALAAVLSVIIGITVSLITNLFGIWRELDYINLILILIRDANDEQIKAIIDKIIEKL